MTVGDPWWDAVAAEKGWIACEACRTYFNPEREGSTDDDASKSVARTNAESQSSLFPEVA